MLEALTMESRTQVGCVSDLMVFFGVLCSLSLGVDSAGRRESYRPTHTPSTHPLDVPAEGLLRPQNPRGIKMGRFEGVERSMQCAQNTLEMPQSRKGRAFSGIPRGLGRTARTG